MYKGLSASRYPGEQGKTGVKSSSCTSASAVSSIVSALDFFYAFNYTIKAYLQRLSFSFCAACAFPAKISRLDGGHLAGERVLGFTVNGRFTGKCIGHKRMIALPPDTREIVLEITQAKAEPVLRNIAVY